MPGVSMKFLLKHLLAITLLLVLSINGINNWHRAKLVGLESEQLQVAIDTELKTTQFFEDKELVYTHDGLWRKTQYWNQSGE